MRGVAQPLVSDTEIHNSVLGILVDGTVADVQDVDLLMASLRDHYEAIYAGLLARIAELEAELLSRGEAGA